MNARPPDEPIRERPIQRPVETQRTTGVTADAAAMQTTFRDRVRWGPIVAGVFTALTTLVIMTILGLAIGMSAFEPDETGARTIGTAAAIWGIISALLAFFLGGWVAGRNAQGSPEDNGAINGFLVGAATIAVMLWLIGAGMGNLLGLVGANVDAITQIVDDANVSQEDVATITQENYDDARDAAWGTLAGLVVALAAATAGGAMGRPDRTVIAAPGATRRPATQPH